MENVAPHQNSFLIGHETAEEMFLNAWKNNALHHAWLISGPEGIGKAGLAYKIARFLLQADEQQSECYQSLNVSEDSQAFRLIAKKAHPDLKILERDFIETDKKKILKAIKEGDALDEDELQELKKSAVIKVDETRTVNAFLSKKSFDGNWRVVLIDSADDLNTASANAILKILEEPPAKTLLLLVSHNPNRLLPTIRSRCAKLILQPLTEGQVATLLRRYRPDLAEKEVKGLAQIAAGSIGRAIKYADGDGLQIYQTLQDLIYARASFDVAAAADLCGMAAKDETTWDLTTELLLKLLADHIRGGENIQVLGEVWDKAGQMLRDANNLNMDKKQVLLSLIYNTNKAVGHVGG